MVFIPMPTYAIPIMAMQAAPVGMQPAMQPLMPTVPEGGAPVAPMTPADSARDAAPVPVPQTLQRTTSVNSSCHRVAVTLNARKLTGNDKQAVSPSFDLNVGGRSAPFKIMIYPTITNEQKGGASFKKSKGKGTVQIKCEEALAEGAFPPLKFRIAIGSGDNRAAFRGPWTHDFCVTNMWALQTEVWDFLSVVDQRSSTFAVVLETQI